jgi:uncharacterized SAM-binding protein YcdF (DUF218 family)
VQVRAQLLERLRRLALFVVIGVVGVAVFYLLWYGLAYLYVSTGNETDEALPSDVIIVLGCPSYEGNVISKTFSACVQARAHHAARLYKRGLAPHIIPTGGFTGPPPSEAAAMGQVMQADGVPASAIVLEEQARDTVGNIWYSRAIMRDRGWRTAILVTEPHHIKRAAFIAGDAGLTFTISSVTDSPGWRSAPARSQNVASDVRNLMTYQLRRILSGSPFQ